MPHTISDQEYTYLIIGCRQIANFVEPIYESDPEMRTLIKRATERLKSKRRRKFHQLHKKV